MNACMGLGKPPPPSSSSGQSPMLADLILQPTIARAHFSSELFIFLLMYDAFGPQELLQNIWLVILSLPPVRTIY